MTTRTDRAAVLLIGFSGLFVALAATYMTAPSAQAPAEPATLVLHNGRVETMDESRPTAQAIAIRGDRIVAVGSNEEIKRQIGPRTQTIDLGGRLAIPGLIDSHVHFTGVGQSRLNLNLMKVKSWDEVVAMVGEAAKKAQPGEPILGRGWHQEKWDRVPSPNVEGFPLHHALSIASPNNPVLLTHASGHATFANARAMQLAGITKATANPPGGEVLKDKEGNPTGLFRETASGLLRKIEADWRAKQTPAEIEARNRKVIQLANEEALSKGLTSVQDAGTSFEGIDLFKKVVDEGKMGVRLYVMVRDSNERLAEKLARYRTIGHGSHRLTVRAIKVSSDGALGSRGAWLLEPYADLPGHTGMNTTPIAAIEETARLAMANGYQLNVHAIGDRANREVLNLFEAAFKANPDKKDVRWRIEHAQHIHPADIPRFGRLGVIASMQGVHATSDGPYVIDRLGERRAREGAYVWRSLIDSNAVVINGTDAPVEDIDPIASFYSTVTRKMANGRLFFPEQKLTRKEALKTYTLAAAYGAFEEDLKGSLKPGKLADVTVLSKDIMTIPDDQIPTAQVVYTIVGGKIAHQRSASATPTSGR